MPFVATTDDGDVIAPEQADDEGEYECPECGETLSIRQSHVRDGDFVARHFWHPNSSSGDGCGGESDTHKRMKSIAMSRASERWPDATVSWEGSIGQKRADVLVEFNQMDDRLGRGIAIECQYRNEGKDIEGTNLDFGEHGYSTLWLYEDDFDKHTVDFSSGETHVWWVGHVPDEKSWSGYSAPVEEIRSLEQPEVDLSLPVIREWVWPHIVPTPDDWSGYSGPVEEIRSLEQPAVNIPLPPLYEWLWPHIVPRDHEWSWYSGVVFWLKQDKPVQPHEVTIDSLRWTGISIWECFHDSWDVGMKEHRRAEADIERGKRYRCQCGVCAYGGSILSHIEAKHSLADDISNLIHEESV